MNNKLRSAARRYLRSRWPIVCFCGAAVLLVVAEVFSTSLGVLLIAIVTVSASAFVAGFSARMRREFPRLDEYRRSEYAAVWNELSYEMPQAMKAAAGELGEDGLRKAGAKVASRMRSRVTIDASTDVLEIGCGVARVGWALAGDCRSWIGTDISKNMLDHAAKRLAAFDNVSFVELSNSGLHEIPSASVDLVYCTNMLPHLSETDRWRYVCEAQRVLRPGGVLYIDTVALDSQEGWAMLENNFRLRQVGIRPPYEPLPSTDEEFLCYFRRAGFVDVRVEREGSLLIAIGATAARIEPANQAVAQDIDVSITARLLNRPHREIPKSSNYSG